MTQQEETTEYDPAKREQRFIDELNRIRDEFGWMEVESNDAQKIIKGLLKFIDVLITKEHKKKH